MRIGVDATCWANGRGYGRFTGELLSAMAAEAPTWRLGRRLAPQGDVEGRTRIGAAARAALAALGDTAR